MNSWSKRRKMIYGSVVMGTLIIITVVPAFLYFYRAPTCFDSKRNGGEQGVDCGGRCVKLCASAFLPAVVAWTRYEKIAPGLYNMASYIINPNTDATAKNVPYRMIIYDRDGVPITTKEGTVTIPPHRNTLALETAINIDKSIPAKAFFEFTAAPDWIKESDPLTLLSYGAGSYIEDSSGSSFTVTLFNNGVLPMNNIAAYVILKDSEDNVVGFSKTIVDVVPPNESAVAPFTWPVKRQGTVISQEVLPVAE